MNIVWHLLIVGVVLIAVVLFILCKIEQRRWDEERKHELRDWDEADE